MAGTVDKILNFIFPPKCPVCGTLLSDGEYLCEECLSEFEKEKNLPAPCCKKSNNKCDCRLDMDFNNSIYRNLHLTQYNLKVKNPAGKKMVLYCKDHNTKKAFEFLGKELAKLCRDNLRLKENDCIVYVPRQKKAVKHAGLDQSYYLAVETARGLKLPMYSALVHRKGEVQKKLNITDRIINAASAYDTGKDISQIAGKRVLLIDDIITTGSTMSACAKLLLSYGAVSVVGVSVCRSYLN